MKQQQSQIKIDKHIRLREIAESDYPVALAWYQDAEIQQLVNGADKPYTMEQVIKMYEYLKTHGECYMIEYYDDEWIPVGDVSVMYHTHDDMPIAIGDKRYWGMGIGTKVIAHLVERERKKGRSALKVECYDYNKRSAALYQRIGFVRGEKTEKGYMYMLRM